MTNCHIKCLSQSLYILMFWSNWISLQCSLTKNISLCAFITLSYFIFANNPLLMTAVVTNREAGKVKEETGSPCSLGLNCFGKCYLYKLWLWSKAGLFYFLLIKNNNNKIIIFLRVELSPRIWLCTRYFIHNVS